jgi:hypothetical protein
MSHVVSIKTELTDLAAIKATCKELGLILKENQKTYRWYGTSVGDYPIPAGFTAADLGKCEHAIQVPGSNYDIGLARAKGAKGLTMLFDFWGTGQAILTAVGGQQASKFIQLYGVNKATIEAKRKGYSVNRLTKADGTIKLTIGGKF